MITKQTIEELFKAAENVKTIKNEIVKFFKNKENSYEDRLWVYLNTPRELFTHSDWTVYVTDYKGEYINWYDYLHLEKYAPFDLVDGLSEIFASKKCDTKIQS